MSIAIMRKALTGVSGVPVTAYDSKGEVEPRITAKVYARVAAAGIHNIVAAGNTGEFYALTPQEIRIVHEAAVSGVDGRAPVGADGGAPAFAHVALGSAKSTSISRRSPDRRSNCTFFVRELVGSLTVSS